MSRLKHKKRAAGGKADVYAGGDSNVLKEAMERKHGGKVEKHRAKGGRVKGEGVGADRMPLSSAAKIKEVTPGEQAEDANED